MLEVCNYNLDGVGAIPVVIDRLRKTSPLSIECVCVDRCLYGVLGWGKSPSRLRRRKDTLKRWDNIEGGGRKI